MNNKYDKIKLENQLCFPLYVCSKEIIRKYKPLLDKLDLTYTQYIVMMVLWEKKSLSVKELGDFLYLDSGTLTPLLKKIEQKGFITRERDATDERLLNVKVTNDGLKLRDEALLIPKEMESCINRNQDEIILLYKILYKILDNVKGE